MNQMETYFNGLSWHEISADTSGVISEMMEILRKNQARLTVLTMYALTMQCQAIAVKVPAGQCLRGILGRLGMNCGCRRACLFWAV